MAPSERSLSAHRESHVIVAAAVFSISGFLELPRIQFLKKFTSSTCATVEKQGLVKSFHVPSLNTYSVA